MKRMGKDLNQAKMVLQRNSKKKRKKMWKKAKNLKKFQRLKEYRDISLLGKCQILSKNKQMNKIDLCKLEKTL